MTTSEESVAQQIRLLRDGGRSTDHISQVVGLNSRLDELQCCFLRAFLPRLSEWNRRRRTLARLYDERLRECAGIRLVARSEESVCHLYVVRAEERERLRASLERQGITTAVHYPVPLHQQPAFADGGARPGDLPQAERACREILSLPLWPQMEPEAVEQIAQAVHRFYR